MHWIEDGRWKRGDFSEDSDIDIMILLDLDDMLIKNYRHELSGITYDFNMDYDIDIKPIRRVRNILKSGKKHILSIKM